jgi:hypothetical protein
MTKPFESIRQLFGRVLGGKSADEDTNALEYSTLGIGSSDTQPSTNGNGHAEVFSHETAPPEIEMQTADTQRLPQLAPEFGDAHHTQVSHDDDADEFGDSPLDLGEVRSGNAFAAGDPVLDVFDEVPPSHFFAEGTGTGRAFIEESTSGKGAFSEGSSAALVGGDESRGAASASGLAEFSDLSPAAVDAIARRVVERLSDKVVQEIAWEVVPELAELMIKQKLEAR